MNFPLNRQLLDDVIAITSHPQGLSSSFSDVFTILFLVILSGSAKHSSTSWVFVFSPLIVSDLIELTLRFNVHLFRSYFVRRSSSFLDSIDTFSLLCAKLCVLVFLVISAKDQSKHYSILLFSIPYWIVSSISLMIKIFKFNDDNSIRNSALIIGSYLLGFILQPLIVCMKIDGLVISPWASIFTPFWFMIFAGFFMTFLLVILTPRYNFHHPAFLRQQFHSILYYYATTMFISSVCYLLFLVFLVETLTGERVHSISVILSPLYCKFSTSLISRPFLVKLMRRYQTSLVILTHLREFFLNHGNSNVEGSWVSFHEKNLFEQTGTHRFRLVCQDESIFSLLESCWENLSLSSSDETVQVSHPTSEVVSSMQGVGCNSRECPSSNVITSVVQENAFDLSAVDSPVLTDHQTAVSSLSRALSSNSSSPLSLSSVVPLSEDTSPCTTMNDPSTVGIELSGASMSYQEVPAFDLEENLCVICYALEPVACLISCGHCVLCWDCCQRLLSNPNGGVKCPLCRCGIEKVYKLERNQLISVNGKSLCPSLEGKHVSSEIEAGNSASLANSHISHLTNALNNLHH